MGDTGDEALVGFDPSSARVHVVREVGVLTTIYHLWAPMYLHLLMLVYEHIFIGKWGFLD